MLVAVALVFLLLFIFLLSLDFITKHGKTLTIPAVTGQSFDNAKATLEKQGFDVVIQDSVYIDTAAPLVVVRQFPDAESEVKMNRTVYLTINRAVPPSIDMPNLVNTSYRSAEMSLEQYGLNLKDTVYKADPARNSVLEQLYEGKPIKPGTKIRMGSDIVLVLGSGFGNTEFPVPDLLGMTFSDAKVLLESTGLVLGAVVAEKGAPITDTANAYVTSQYPPRLTAGNQVNKIHPGQIVDIHLSDQKPVRQVDSNAAKQLSDSY